MFEKDIDLKLVSSFPSIHNPMLLGIFDAAGVQ